MDNWIIHRIQQQGYKLTPSRRQIFDWLDTHPGLFSANHILEANNRLDKVSVYRTLELLETLDIIRRAATVDDQLLYELHNHDEHHHHIICIHCKKDACVPCVMPEQSPRIKGFSDIHHDVHFSGICRDCR